MSLPPGFLDELRARVPISRIIGRKVVWDNRKSNQARGDWWAPCPFHQEKTASFHCDDQKGFYYCFGCHAKGDALTFLRENDGMEFMEAVRAMADEAGMAMPARDPQAQEKASRRDQLREVVDASLAWFRLQLNTGRASEARDYLARRGLEGEALDQFEIGFAPNDRQALTHALREKGFAPDLIVEAGMAIKPDDGGAPYDRFRGRIIFPIRDGQGRAIGFGGRAMDPNARAKYLNSPETPLFDKGRNLYNLGPARSAVSKGAKLIVAEGYMDVIALSRAGFGGAVAPLGTAVTEEQLQALWRVSPEPVIMLDGDEAGQRAAMRLVDLALPMTGPGQALRFAVMPPGLDPDDLIAAKGAGAMAEQIDRAVPLVDLLWQRETEGRDFDSPERRAALDEALGQAIAKIPDGATRGHYQRELKNKRWQHFAPKREAKSSRSNWQGNNWRRGAPSQPLASTRASAMAGQDVGEAILEGAALLICALRPELVDHVETRLERLVPVDADRAALLHDLVCRSECDAGQRALEQLRADAHLGLTPGLITAQDDEDCLHILANILDRIEAARSVRIEARRAEMEIEGEVDEGLTWRMTQINLARHRAERPEMSDTSDLGEDRDQLSARLNGWLSGEIWRKLPKK